MESAGFLSQAEYEHILKYLELKRNIAELEEALDALKPRLYNIVSEQPDSFLELDGLRLVVSKKDTYEYSIQVKDIEKMLRQMKRTEERGGFAKLTRSTGFVRVERIEECEDSHLDSND
jgi:regulator of replication initiation timing